MTEPLTFRRAIRMADMMIRSKRDQIRAAGTMRGGRIRKAEAEKAALLHELSQEIWNKLGRSPPQTPVEADAIERAIEEDWP